jgi:hypothetical protein
MSSRRDSTTFLRSSLILTILNSVGIAHELVQILRRHDVDLGNKGENPSTPNVDGQAAFDDRAHLALDDAAVRGTL